MRHSSHTQELLIGAPSRQLVADWWFASRPLHTAIPWVWSLPQPNPDRLSINRLLECDAVPLGTSVWLLSSETALPLSTEAVTPAGITQPERIFFHEDWAAWVPRVLCVPDLPEFVLEFGVAHLKLRQRYRIRCLFRLQTSVLRFVGWKIQERWGLESSVSEEQVVWSVTEAERIGLEGLLEGSGICSQAEMRQGNHLGRERERRQRWNRRLQE